MTNEPVTLRERYANAMSSSRLRMELNRRGDGDVIAAAGAAAMPDHVKNESLRTGQAPTIGGMLNRLMAEYDNIRGPRAIARRNYEAADTREHARIEAATAVNRESGRRARIGEAAMTPDEVRACVSKASEAMRDQIAHDAKMAHAFVLMRMPSLATTRTAFGAWALLMANKRGFMDVGPMPVDDPEKSGLMAMWRKGKRAQQTVTLALAGQVLDLTLEPNCYRCEGRGFSGGYNNAPQRICNDERKGGCNGTGRRPTDKLGNCREQREFAEYLLIEVDIMLERQAREMKAKLQDEPAAVAA